MTSTSICGSRARGIAAAVALLLASPAPASAQDATVGVSYLVRAVRHGEGELAVAECDATANPGTTGWTARATTLTCSLNGFSQTRTLQGGHSVVVVVNAVIRPLTLCYAAAVEFTTSGAPVHATTGPHCVAA